MIRQDSFFVANLDKHLLSSAGTRSQTLQPAVAPGQWIYEPN
jgi:hypothetical protein